MKLRTFICLSGGLRKVRLSTQCLSQVLKMKKASDGWKTGDGSAMQRNSTLERSDPRKAGILQQAYRRAEELGLCSTHAGKPVSDFKQ